METKKWYQSKTILIAVTTFLVAGSDLLFKWLSGEGVTQTQIGAIQGAYPDIAEGIRGLQSGESIYQFISMLVSVGVTVFRVWFTESKIAKAFF